MYDIDIRDFFTTAFSVDCVILGFDDEDLKVLLIERGAQPFMGKWALPGDLVYPNESLDNAADRVLSELTGLSDVFMEQYYTFGATDRHPLGRVITTAYYSLIRIKDYKVQVSSWAKSAKWYSLNEIPDLAFDHNEIAEKARIAFRRNIRSKPIGFELLPEEFTLTQLQNLFEVVLEREIDKRNFRKKILGMNILLDLNTMQQNVTHRPAKLYGFDKSRYEEVFGDNIDLDRLFY